MLSKKIGIDLGTSTVLVYVKGEGVVVNEPAVMATDEKGARVLAVGRAASELVGRGGKTRAVRPVRDGNGIDYDVAGAMLQHLIGRIVGRQRIFRPDVMLSVEPMVTGVERRAVLEATIQAGPNGLPDRQTDGRRDRRPRLGGDHRRDRGCQRGAGSTEVAAIALGEMLAMESVGIGGHALDQAIDAAILKQHGLRLLPGEAERLKIQLGVANTPAPESALEVGATDAGRPPRRPTACRRAEVQAALLEPLGAIVASLQRVLAQVPEARRASVNRNGAVLTGGGAQLRGLAEFLAGRTGIPMRVARDPQSCVAVGTGMALDNLQVIRRGQHYIT